MGGDFTTLEGSTRGGITAGGITAGGTTAGGTAVVGNTAGCAVVCGIATGGTNTGGDATGARALVGCEEEEGIFGGAVTPTAGCLEVESSCCPTPGCLEELGFGLPDAATNSESQKRVSGEDTLRISPIIGFGQQKTLPARRRSARRYASHVRKMHHSAKQR